ncbi:MAG: hypothetical protein AAGM36_10830, partial [Cyanobacteria bacterium J06597_1]
QTSTTLAGLLHHHSGIDLGKIIAHPKPVSHIGRKKQETQPHNGFVVLPSNHRTQVAPSS